MDLAEIINQYYDPFMAKYEKTILPTQLNALNAILRCRTSESGEVFVACPQCDHMEWRPMSCGNRNCPKCQNHNTSQWIDRQQLKLLPVEYFMITFTLPFELRSLAWQHQREVYTLFFSCVSSTLKDFGLNPKHLGAEIGMTMVLHTNNRKLDYHPHIHVFVPGGGIDKARRQWKKKKGKYLFNHKALATVFRARFLDGLNKARFSIPPHAPHKWVVDSTHVGKGMSALKYLSKYLYRGVITESNIISNRNGMVTFRYIQSDTGDTKYRTLKGEDFLHLIMQHVLPKGFRRVRDYGFLHSNSKALLVLVQLVLHAHIPQIDPRPRPVFKCPCCKSPMIILGFRVSIFEPG